MPNINHDTHVLCPYFRSEKKMSISCEDTFRTFGSLKIKKAWMYKYCDHDWNGCPYAAALNRAYENYYKGDKMAVERNENEALKKELESMSKRLGRANKKIERYMKRIDMVQAQNASLKTLNTTLTEKIHRMKPEKYKPGELEKIKADMWVKLNKAVGLYSDRLCFAIDRLGGELKDKDLEKWSKGKEYAVRVEESEDGKVWRSYVREAKTNEQDNDRGVSEDDGEKA